MTEARRKAYKQLEQAIASASMRLPLGVVKQLYEAYKALYEEDMKMEDDGK